ncbi:MAG: radical SAM protein [Candidatus Hecatellales archaeon]|nr:MAG: radical SAM protein [Candidatus Hecatellales archaeon]
MVKPLFKIGREVPLVGCLAFGLIDRGTNLIQVRPSSLCPLSCVFCSTDAGPKSRRRQTEYLVELEYLVEAFREVAAFKGSGLEAHIDTVGDPLTYPQIVELVEALSRTQGVKVVSMQSKGYLLSERLAEELSEAGLSRLNLSIDALNSELAVKLSGTPSYKVERILGVAEHVAQNTKTDLLIAPVWVPGLNDGEIPKIIEFALKIGAGKRWPPLGIQRYEAHKRGRRPEGVKAQSWKSFYGELRRLERRFQVKLVISREDFSIQRRAMLPIPYRVGQRLRVKIVGPGWLKGEALASTLDRLRSLTIVGLKQAPPVGTEIRVKLIGCKHNILLAEPV